MATLYIEAVYVLFLLLLDQYESVKPEKQSKGVSPFFQNFYPKCYFRKMCDKGFPREQN